MLSNIASCGCDFSELEPQIASTLYSRFSDESPSKDECRRRGDFSCTSLDAEGAVGDAILTALSAHDWDQDILPFIAQGFLGNEDAWLQQSPPTCATTCNKWPQDDPYGGQAGMENAATKAALLNIALNHDVAPGWKTIAAQAFFYTRNSDVVVRVWWSQQRDDLILRPHRTPTCPSGRTFLWWLGDFFEPPTPDDALTSAFFVGGHQKLHHCQLTILPSTNWRDLLGWCPNPRNPLVWLSKEGVVARYDRIHGPLRDNRHGPHYRQPVVHRWLVSDEGFNQFEKVAGSLRLNDDFEVHPFKAE
jgi:hypothetical protein